MNGKCHLHILMWSLFEPNLNTCKTFEMKPFSLLSCSGMCCMELDVHRVWSDNVLLWSYEISSYHFHLNDILVKWHIKQCAHVVVVLVHFAKKKIQFLPKGFEMQTNDLQSLVCILFVWRLRTLQVVYDLISSSNLSQGGTDNLTEFSEESGLSM